MIIIQLIGFCFKRQTQKQRYKKYFVPKMGGSFSVPEPSYSLDNCSFIHATIWKIKNKNSHILKGGNDGAQAESLTLVYQPLSLFTKLFAS